ncbi:MAG: hypothetical protein HC800_09890 [Phormidesmis sp. RL_2_1]|nr:hypothetical protein [Phormidesmis sp. RL_2_1]
MSIKIGNDVPGKIGNDVPGKVGNDVPNKIDNDVPGKLSYASGSHEQMLTCSSHQHSARSPL